MPFSMTHLSIAYNIIQNTPEIKNPNEFMLGATAPDAVHFRENYNSNLKKNSHLCIGNEAWGNVTNNKEWLKNVLNYLRKNSNSYNTDFIHGYCSHIIADIQNNIKIWTPFKLDQSDNKQSSNYHQESYAVDYELYLLHPQKEIIWQMIRNAKGYNLNDMIKLNEILKMKDDLLNNQYQGRDSMNISNNKYVTMTKMQDFISNESQYIKNLMYS